MVPFLPPILKKPRSFLTQNRLIFITMNDNAWKYQPSKKKKDVLLYATNISLLLRNAKLCFLNSNHLIPNYQTWIIFLKKTIVIMFTFWKLSKRRITYIWLKSIESRCVHFWPDWYHSSTCNRCSFFTKKWRMNTW